MAYIGSKPANKPVVASDLDPTVITGQTALAVAPADTDEFLISDAGVLKRLDASLIGGTNTPFFFAFANGNQTIANNTYTKVEIDAEVVDADSTYDVSNYRFTPAVAGYYIIGGMVRFDDGADGTDHRIGIYKNGSTYQQDVSGKVDVTTLKIKQVVYLDADDYVELFVSHNTGADQAINGASSFDSTCATFYGYRLIT